MRGKPIRTGLNRATSAPACPSPERERFCEDHEEYRGLEDARDADAATLLFYPCVHSLKDYAFRRAAEAAAMDHPLLAASWLRLLRLVDQSHPPYMPPTDTLSAPDHLRAALLRAQREGDDANLAGESGR